MGKRDLKSNCSRLEKSKESFLYLRRSMSKDTPVPRIVNTDCVGCLSTVYARLYPVADGCGREGPGTGHLFGRQSEGLGKRLPNIKTCCRSERIFSLVSLQARS